MLRIGGREPRIRQCGRFQTTPHVLVWSGALRGVGELQQWMSWARGLTEGRSACPPLLPPPSLSRQLAAPNGAL
eukprot:228695-Pyramimonas_sp.AAC.2